MKDEMPINTLVTKVERVETNVSIEQVIETLHREALHRLGILRKKPKKAVNRHDTNDYYFIKNGHWVQRIYYSTGSEDTLGRVATEREVKAMEALQLLQDLFAKPTVPYQDVFPQVRDDR